MKPTNVCLSKSEISALLSSDLLPDETASAEQHIAECEACRTAIESMIADSRWWSDAQQSLAAFSSRARSEADSSHEAEPTSTEQMLSLLGPTDDPEKIGRIAEYEVIGIIGRGGMGVVFKAFDPRLNRFVAIKMLLPHLAASGAARKRFAREGQAAAAVVDDFVLPIHAVSEWKGVPYLVTQYSRGTTLQKRVQSEGPLEVKEILRLGMQTARGLAAAHAQGLVHRDVKPSNVLLDGSVERAMLTDFGLARAVDDASITRTGVIAGTPQYMSPEQARGGSVDARSDLFSLGCVLYFLCTGHPPFRADNSYAILRLITDEEPRSIRETNPDVPAWLCTIVQKLMAKKAEDRYGSASEVADVLEECLAHVSNPLKNPLPTVVSRPSLRFPWNAIMSDKRILSLVAFGLFLAAFLLPWPIAAIGRDEHALIFAGVSMLLAVTFAVMSRRESFSRIVLVTVGGMFGLLLVGVLLSVPIYYARGRAAENESQLRAMNDAIAATKSATKSEPANFDLQNSRFFEGPFPGEGFDWWQDPSHRRTLLPEGIETGRRNDPLYSEARQSLADAVRELNEQSAEDRRTLFAPPIPDMTEELLRKGLAQQAELYRQDGKNHIADLLDRIVKSGDVPRDGKTSRIFLGGEILLGTDKTQILRKQIAPAITVAESSGSPRRYVVIETLMLRYSQAGRTSRTYGDNAEGNSDPASAKVPIKILLSAATHSNEMLEKNLNYQGLSLYGAGVMARAEGSDASAPATVVIAHNCTLRAFEEVERDGEKFWNTTLVVPMQNELLDLQPGMTLEEAEAKFDPKAFQDRLDNMWKDGARFELDHYLGQEPTPPVIAAPAGLNPDGEQKPEDSKL